MTVNEIIDVLGTNRARWEIQNMTKALSYHAWLNSPPEAERLKAGRAALRNWRAYQAECNKRRALLFNKRRGSLEAF